LGTFLRRRGVLVPIDINDLSLWELDALAEAEAQGGMPELRTRVDPAITLIAASRELDRAADRLRLVRFDGRPPATDLPPRKGGAIWP